jgi:hypothetical protein
MRTRIRVNLRARACVCNCHHQPADPASLYSVLVVMSVLNACECVMATTAFVLLIYRRTACCAPCRQRCRRDELTPIEGAAAVGAAAGAAASAGVGVPDRESEGVSFRWNLQSHALAAVLLACWCRLVTQQCLYWFPATLSITEQWFAHEMILYLPDLWSFHAFSLIIAFVGTLTGSMALRVDTDRYRRIAIVMSILLLVVAVLSAAFGQTQILVLGGTPLPSSPCLCAPLSSSPRAC